MRHVWIVLVVGCAGELTTRTDADVSDSAQEDGAVADAPAADAPADDSRVSMDSTPVPPDAIADGGDDAPGDAGTDTAPVCVTVTMPDFLYEVTAAEESRMVPLELSAGSTYRTLTIDFEVNPVTWNEACWNPFRATPAFVAPHQSIVELSKGTSTKWCHGGNLFHATARGRPNNNYWVRSFYKDRPDGRCSGILSIEHTVLAPARQTLATGTFQPVRYELDVTSGTMDMQLGTNTYSGPLDPDARINTVDPLFLVFSFNEYAECYNTAGDLDPTAACCWRPSSGWIYRNLSYTACE